MITHVSRLFPSLTVSFKYDLKWDWRDTTLQKDPFTVGILWKNVKVQLSNIKISCDQDQYCFGISGVTSVKNQFKYKCHEHSQTSGMNNWICKVLDKIRNSCPVIMLTELSNPFWSPSCPHNDPFNTYTQCSIGVGFVSVCVHACMRTQCVGFCVCVRESQSVTLEFDKTDISNFITVCLCYCE